MELALMPWAMSMLPKLPVEFTESAKPWFDSNDFEDIK